jgi:hypothetical protein
MSTLTNRDLGRIKKYAPKDTPKGVASAVKASSSWKRTKELHDLLWMCRTDWEAMRNLREEHKRNQRYKNGHQWDDLITDPDDPSKKIREREYISRQGKTAIQNNLIQQIDRNIHGQALSNPTQPVVVSRSEDDTSYSEMLTNTLQYGLKLNKYNTIKTAALESLASAGYAVGKVGYGLWSQKNRKDVKVGFVNINRVFFNQDAEEPTLDDIYRIGEIHDYTWAEMRHNFFTGKESDMKVLREEYSQTLDNVMPSENDTAEENIRNLDFFVSSHNNKYRVYEVWTREIRSVVHVHDKAKGEEIFDEVNGAAYYEHINAVRRAQLEGYGFDEEVIESQLIDYEVKTEYYWRAQWLTPQGICIKSMETPYAHQTHPYVIVSMPRIDGVVTPIYSNLRDIQRTINRHLTLVDFALAHAAKGALMVPKSMLEHTSLAEITYQYSRPNGVLIYDDSKAIVNKPSQLATSPIPAGTFEFINTEIRQLQEVSGLSGALSGQVARSGTPSSLYAQQAQNSMLNFVLLFECFREFNASVSEKVLHTQMQYYTTRRHVDISGQVYNKTAIYYDPDVIDKIVDWNVVVTEATDTPVFRQLADDMLWKLFEAKAINVEMLLENSSAPFAQKLLAEVRAAQQQMEQGQQAMAQQTMGGIDLGALQQEMGAQPTAQSLSGVQQAYDAMTDADIQQPMVA